MRDPLFSRLLKYWIADRVDEVSVAIAAPTHWIRWRLHRLSRRLRQ